MSKKKVVDDVAFAAVVILTLVIIAAVWITIAFLVAKLVVDCMLVLFNV